MSPSEFDLRAALHDGEDGADLNVDQLVGAAQARVAQRRVRIISTVTITVLAAGLGVGAAAVLNHDNSPRSSAAKVPGGVLQPAQGRRDAASRTAGLPAGSSAVSHGGVGAVLGPVAGCPASITDLEGSTPYSTARHDPQLFSTPVSTVVVCAYGTGAGAGSPGKLQLQGTEASALADSLNSDSKVVTPMPEVSPQNCAEAGKVGQQYEIIGLAPNGKTTSAVTAQFVTACGATVTNGRTTRYSWLPPPTLRDEFFSITPK